MSSTTTRGIIFDLDGTLYHMKWFMKPLLTLKVLPNFLRLPRFMKIRGTFAGKDLESENNLLTAICDSLSRSEKCSSQDIRNWIASAFYPAFVSIMPYFRGSRPGISETLITLKKNGIKLGVLSDYSSVAERLVGLGLSNSLFNSMTSSESFGALKPSCRPFLSIASEWNIPPEQILIVGDRDDTDGEAARGAGMQFLQIRERGSRPNGGIIWEEVRERLKSINVKI